MHFWTPKVLDLKLIRVRVISNHVAMLHNRIKREYYNYCLCEFRKSFLFKINSTNNIYVTSLFLMSHDYFMIDAYTLSVAWWMPQGAKLRGNVLLQVLKFKFEPEPALESVPDFKHHNILALRTHLSKNSSLVYMNIITCWKRCDSITGLSRVRNVIYCVQLMQFNSWNANGQLFASIIINQRECARRLNLGHCAAARTESQREKRPRKKSGHAGDFTYLYNSPCASFTCAALRQYKSGSEILGNKTHDE